MADKNIQMTQRNADNTGWDNINPITKAANVKFADGTDVESHKADSMILTASGTNNAITLDVTLKDKNKYSFKAIANSTGAVTINGIALKKLDNTAVSNIKTNKVYDFYYDQLQNSVFILAKAEGDAIVGDVLAGKFFSNGDESGLVGTMDLSNLTADNIKKDVTINGITGTAITAAKPIGGSTLILSSDTMSSITTSSPTKVKEIKINIAGTYRVKFDIQASTTYIAYGQIYVNGVARGILRQNSNAIWVTYSEDITVNANDLIQLYVYGSSKVYYQNFRIYIGNPIDYGTLTL